jgi:tRNA pseudouridine55 synthase
MLILVDKPKWFTSFDIIRKIKKIYPWEKIGHAWTLDPLATGLLVIAVGKDTKLLHHLSWVDKAYKTTIDLSLQTDTRDSDARKYSKKGEYTKKAIKLDDGRTTPLPSLHQIEYALENLLAQRTLPLPPFSAKKLNGKKLYEYARAWNPVLLHTPMQVTSYEIESYTWPYLQLNLEVTSGTYIRSIAYRLWEQLNTYWALIALQRTRVWEYYLAKNYKSNATTLSDKYFKKASL